jgi:hypothetical protein
MREGAFRRRMADAMVRWCCHCREDCRSEVNSDVRRQDGQTTADEDMRSVFWWVQEMVSVDVLRPLPGDFFLDEERLSRESPAVASS